MKKKIYFGFKILKAFIFAVIFAHQLNANMGTSNTPRVLLIDSWSPNFSTGLIQTNFAQAKTFFQNNIYLLLLYLKGSYYEQLVHSNECWYRSFAKTITMNEISQICEQYSINIIISTRYQELQQLRNVSKKIKIVFYRVATLEEDNIRENMDSLKNIDAIISNPSVVEFIQKANIEKQLNIKEFEVITPFWNEKKFTHFATTETRQEYFKKQFNIEVGSDPVICTLANFQFAGKNYPVLLNAIHTLIYEKKCIVHAMLAGSGRLQKEMEQLAQKLKIQNYVHFLGSTSETPAILYHSDIHVLPSSFENFSLANLEAAIMKKAIIVADSTSTARMIINHESGLHFKNNNASDLADKICYLVAHKHLREFFGNNIYRHVLKNYSNQVIFTQWKNVLNRLLIDIL